jgi:hypothetical protein
VELSLAEGLRFQPVQGRAGTVGTAYVLRDDALEAHGLSRSEHLGAGAGHLAAKRNLRQVGLAENVLQDAAPLVEWLVAEVVAIEHQQVKGKES